MNGLKEKRKALKLTQRELGEKIGVAANTITYYEKGKREPNFEILKKLTNVFNCTIDELM